eukprot:15471049-Alexandrium_andersonii.AAC.1
MALTDLRRRSRTLEWDFGVGPPPLSGAWAPASWARPPDAGELALRDPAWGVLTDGADGPHPDVGDVEEGTVVPPCWRLAVAGHRCMAAMLRS